MNQYKEYGVVMTPCKNNGIILQGVVDINHLVTLESVKDDDEWLTFGKPQHLHITSNEEIKKGDWYTNGKQIFQCDDIKHVDKERYTYLKKIISTTDKLEINNNFDYNQLLPDSVDFKFYLPLIHNSFVEQYCESRGKIDKVWKNYLKSIKNIMIS